MTRKPRPVCSQLRGDPLGSPRIARYSPVDRSRGARPGSRSIAASSLVSSHCLHSALALSRANPLPIVQRYIALYALRIVVGLLLYRVQSLPPPVCPACLGPWRTGTAAPPPGAGTARAALPSARDTEAAAHAAAAGVWTAIGLHLYITCCAAFPRASGVRLRAPKSLAKNC